MYLYIFFITLHVSRENKTWQMRLILFFFLHFNKQPHLFCCLYCRVCLHTKQKFAHKKTSLGYLFYKIIRLQGCNSTKKTLQHRCFPVNFAKVLRTPILENICQRLLLHIPSLQHNFGVVKYVTFHWNSWRSNYYGMYDFIETMNFLRKKIVFKTPLKILTLKLLQPVRIL